ncbi:MAG: exonuclease domain-containing protein [Myxococcota bacterium]
MPWRLPLPEVTFVSVDLETTGLAPGFDRIIEVGVARFRVRADGSVVAGAVFDELVDPGKAILPTVSTLTGISNEDVAAAPPIEALWPAIVEALRPEGPTILLAHNAAFDVSFLLAAAALIDPTWTPPPAACTVRIARRTLPDAPRYALEVLVNWLGCGGDSPSHHRALADALHARNLFARCVARSGARSMLDLGVSEPVPTPALADIASLIPPGLRGLEAAIAEQRLLHIRYRGGSKGTQRRPITPQGFYVRDGVLYLRAVCHVDQVAKSFRCDRIRDIDR